MSSSQVTDEDKVHCETIAKSISDIIRFSLDEEYRRSCFNLLGVHSTKEVENEINRRLISLIENESSIPKKRGRKSKQEKDAQNCSDDLNKNSTVKETISATDTNHETLPKNNSQRNWLEISSQQFRDEVKRKKLQFYSQPSFTELHRKSFHFPTSDFHFSNSQPSSESPSTSQNFTLRDSLGDRSDNDINFPRKKFKYFDDDILKYFE